MPYPREFRPATTVTVNDARGNIATSLDCQIFKPLLGCSFNGQQPFIVNHKLPNQAAIILRSLVHVPTGSGLDLRVGPKYWATGLVPSMVLSEDPSAQDWWWMDALPWNFIPGGRIWSVFAATDYLAPPPPPPPPPTPITMGTTSPAAPLVVSGTSYVSTIPAGGTGWVYTSTPTGVAYTMTLTSGGTISTTTQGHGGTHGTPVNEGAPFTNNGTTTIPGGVHTGPDATMSIANGGLAPITVTYNM